MSPTTLSKKTLSKVFIFPLFWELQKTSGEVSQLPSHQYLGFLAPCWVPPLLPQNMLHLSYLIFIWLSSHMKLLLNFYSLKEPKPLFFRFLMCASLPPGWLPWNININALETATPLYAASNTNAWEPHRLRHTNIKKGLSPLARTEKAAPQLGKGYLSSLPRHQGSAPPVSSHVLSRSLGAALGSAQPAFWQLHRLLLSAAECFLSGVSRAGAREAYW